MYTEVVDVSSVRRAEVEKFIRSRYRDAYGAALENFPDHLIASFFRDGRPAAAAGLRHDVDGFFSECYLDEPVEITASRILGKRLTRSSLLEVTSFTSVGAHSVFPLMSAIMSYGRDQKISCGLFTITEGLRDQFRRLNIPLSELTPAKASRVAQCEIWGSYYSANPWVCLMPNPIGPLATLFPRCGAAPSISKQEVVHHG